MYLISGEGDFIDLSHTFMHVEQYAYGRKKFKRQPSSSLHLISNA